MKAAAAEEKFDFGNPRPLPDEYPLPRPSVADQVFPTANGHVSFGGPYLNYYEGQCKHVPREWERRADMLFFKGGSLESVGLKPKPEYTAAEIMAALRWLLGSWSPKHEEKAATVGFALSKWCEVIDQ